MCSFSCGKTFLALLTFQSFCIVSSCQFAAAQTEDAALKTEIQTDVALPKPAEPLPPAIPQREVPIPPAVSHNASLGEFKPPLAWRQKAFLLSMDKYKNGDRDPALMPKNGLTRCVASSYSDTIMALAGSCASVSYKSEQLNSNAGELLVSSPDGKTRFIFCVWEQSPAKTMISACIDKGKNSESQKVLTGILDTTYNTISRRGKI